MIKILERLMAAIAPGKFFLIVWLTPVFLIGGFNFVVDPYNYNGVFNLPLNKGKVADRASHRIWKLAAFYRRTPPETDLILGDSRGDYINTRKVMEATGATCINLAYGGGTAYEMVDTFYEAAKKTKVKRVYFCMNFNLYNRYNHMNLVPEAIETLSDPVRYYYSGFITKVARDCLLDKLESKAEAAKPPMSREEFWRYQLEFSAKGFYGRYAYPDDLHKKLVGVKKYCDERGIELTFIIPPTHTDLQGRIGDFGLKEAEARFKKDLQELGTVYDFDIDLPVTRTAENFDDPFHGKRTGVIYDWVIDTVWRGRNKYGAAIYK